MENAKGVKLFKALDDLEEDMPDLCFLEKLFLLFFFCYSITKVAVIGEIHDHTILLPYLPQGFCALVHEGLLVPYNVWVSDWGQDSDLVEGIFFLFLGKV